MNVEYCGCILSFQIRVRASDGGNPRLTATATIDVTVTRNLFAPEWLQQNYTITILESQEIGNSILQLNAQDRDIDVSVMFI